MIYTASVSLVYCVIMHSGAQGLHRKTLLKNDVCLVMMFSIGYNYIAIEYKVSHALQ